MAAIPMASARGQNLERRLTPRLDQPPLDRHHWGIAVLDDHDRLLFGRNADRLFMPASNTKLVVTAAAAVLLDLSSRIRTPIHASGPIQNGILLGDLVISGQGDPTWARRCFALDTLAPGACQTDPFEPLRAAAGTLKRLGLTRIAGAVVGDGSLFEPTLLNGTWEHDDLVWGYAAPVSAIGFNENTVVATVWPTEPGTPAAIELAPDLGALAIENRVITVDDTGGTDVTWSRGDDGVTAVATGTVRRGDRGDRSQLAVADPGRYAALAFASVLADSGIAVLGGVASTTDSTVYRAARANPPLAEVVSRPIGDWLFPILNVSQNWVAEMLLKQLGRRFRGEGSWRAGIEVERRFLIDQVGLDSTQFVLHDGSGLSAKDGISPLSLTRLLAFVRRQPAFPTFAAGLPRSGSVGSLRNRFLDTPVAARVRAKTGSIGQVNTLSGYLDAEDPGAAPCRIFSVQANHHALSGRAMIQAIDSVVVEIGRKTRCAKR